MPDRFSRIPSTRTAGGRRARPRLARVVGGAVTAGVLTLVAATPASAGVPTTVYPYASPSSIVLGEQAMGVATVSGGVNTQPTGTLTFSFYLPTDPTCTAAPEFTSTVPIDPMFMWWETYSGPFTPAVSGRHQLVVSYGGDATYDPSVSSCGAAPLTVRAADAVITPDTVTFASAQAPQPTGSTGPSQRLTITNAGDEPLRIDGFTLSGANPDDFLISGDTCRQTVAVNATCTADVRFTPQAAGDRTATLSMLSNDPFEPAVTLNGTGGGSPQGTAGTPGAPGAAGATGTAGTAGTDGAAGTAGASGPAGATGAAGAAGAAGATGATGPIGLTGGPGSRSMRLICSAALGTCRMVVVITRSERLISGTLVGPGRVQHTIRSISAGGVLRNSTGRALRVGRGTYKVKVRVARRGASAITRSYSVKVVG